jgi:polysaccharide biosynthesis protein PslG
MRIAYSVLRIAYSVLRRTEHAIRSTFLLLLISLTACAPVYSARTPTPTSWPRPRLASPEYGIQAFLYWNYEAADRDLKLIQDMGFTWVKTNIAWREVEGIEKGAYDWARTDRMVKAVRRAKLNLIARVDFQPFWTQAPGANLKEHAPPEDMQNYGDFCHALAEHYKGKIRAYQVWNEPNLTFEWGDQPPDPARYVEMLKACYIGVKTADPDALVISAGMAPTGSGLPAAIPDNQYIEKMYQAGAAPYFDLLGVHASGYKEPPETSPDEAAKKYNGNRFFCFRHVEDIRKIMERYGDANKQIALLEFGWTTDQVHPDYSWYAVTPEQQADYLVRAYQYAKAHWSPWIGPMVTLSIASPFDTEDKEQYWWAITYPDFPDTRVRPAYDALRAMPK